jgi:hypothetical protein
VERRRADPRPAVRVPSHARRRAPYVAVDGPQLTDTALDWLASTGAPELTADQAAELVALRKAYGLSAADIYGPDALPAWEVDLLVAAIAPPDTGEDERPPDTAAAPGSGRDEFAPPPALLDHL